MLYFTLFRTHCAVDGYGGTQLYNVGMAWGATHYPLLLTTIRLQALPSSCHHCPACINATQQTSSKIAAIPISNLPSPLATWQLPSPQQLIQHDNCYPNLLTNCLPGLQHPILIHMIRGPIVLTSVKLNMYKIKCITDKNTRNSIWLSQNGIL